MLAYGNGWRLVGRVSDRGVWLLSVLGCVWCVRRCVCSWLLSVWLLSVCGDVCGVCEWSCVLVCLCESEWVLVCGCILITPVCVTTEWVLVCGCIDKCMCDYRASVSVWAYTTCVCVTTEQVLVCGRIRHMYVWLQSKCWCVGVYNTCMCDYRASVSVCVCIWQMYVWLQSEC